MIDRLPVEVFLNCLDFLSKNEQLECLSVNKSLYNAIQISGKLHESIVVSKPKDFASMRTFFDKNKEFSKQVKKLQIINVRLDINAYMALPVLFPNIKEFSFVNPDYPIRGYNSRKVLAAFNPWAVTLTSLKEAGTPVIAFTLLSKKSCPQLQRLSLDILGIDDEEKKFVLYDYLKSCPNLKILDLNFANTTLEHMEKIHKYLPNLKTLLFRDIGFPESRFKSTPAPAHSMETLFLDEITFLGNMDMWLVYFSQKYPNLRNLIIGKAEDMYDGQIAYEDKYEASLVKLVTGLKTLEFYSVQCLKLTSAVFDAMDRAGVRLKKIELGIYEAEDSFPLLVKSQQITSLTSLTISGTSYESMAYGDKKKFIQDLAKFPNLKHFRINQSKEEVDGPQSNRVPLDFMLESLRSLESMQMDFFTLEITREMEEPFDTKLKKLVIEECYVEALALKGQEDWNERSEAYLRKLLPNTDIEVRWLDDTPLDEEYSHLFQ
ncbi:hypothetical protein BD408DRAFT_25925 [Parasitella parasitica]|nr:hypothetical protein BD408DRAFT_25925 [Parasitella parasitica]